jgi:hypothetical protein
VPVVGPRHRVPGPVRGLVVLEDDARVPVALRGVAPDVELPLRRPGGRLTGPLEPGVLVRGVVDDQLGDHPDAPLVGGAQQPLEVPKRPVVRVHAVVVGNVVAVVLERRRVKRQEPDRGDAEADEVVEAVDQSAEVADPVLVAVGEALDRKLVDHGIPVPQRVFLEVDVSVGHRCLPLGLRSRPRPVLTGSSRSPAPCAGAGGARTPTRGCAPVPP